MHARFYDPDMGRFLSVDPVLDLRTNMTNPQGWNRYSYVRNNPLRWTDPTGRVIAYDDQFKKRVREDAVFRAAFEAWKTTKSGATQWRTMARDTDTKYTLQVGDASYQPSILSHRFQANGRTVPPPAMARENESGRLNNPWTETVIDADRMQRDGGAARTQARTIAGALFEEVAHALDLGSGSRTEREAYMAEEQFHADPSPTEPRWIQFMKELDQILPPEP
ncbi:MAG: RHS repeat-associated core domain-containing protein, partial [Acidobacteriota bacterium]